MLAGPDSPAMQRLAQLWPMKRFPVLVDGDRTVLEASCIIKYLGLHHPGPVRLIPEEPRSALDVRMLDRFFGTSIIPHQQNRVFECLRPPAQRTPYVTAQRRH